MFRRWRTTPSGAGSHQSRRDKRRFVPSLSGSASCLEDRVVLSGAGHVAHAVHPAVVHHGHTAGAAGQHGLAAAGTHAATHHGHSATAQSHHGLAAAGTPGAVWAYTTPWSGSPATFSTTTTSHLGTGTVSSDPALGGPDVRRALHRDLEPFKVPDVVHVLAELPTTGNGKVDRSGLSALLPVRAAE